MRTTSPKPNTFDQTLIAQIILITDCACATYKNTSPGHQFPVELIDLVVDYAIEDFRSTKDASGITVLMHTSSIIRYKVDRVFAPIMISDGGFLDFPETPRGLRVNFCLVAHMGALIAYHLSDFSVKRHGLAKPEGVECVPFVGNASAFNAPALTWKLVVTPEQLWRNGTMRVDHEILPHQVGFAQVTSSTKDMALTSSDVYRALETTFTSLDASTWRFASPFDRALVGRVETSTSSKCCVYLSMDTAIIRVWQFDTRASPATLRFDRSSSLGSCT